MRAVDTYAIMVSMRTETDKDDEAAQGPPSSLNFSAVTSLIPPSSP